MSGAAGGGPGATHEPLSVLELFCGIGGMAAALASVHPGARVLEAVDQDRDALAVYRTNFPHPVAPHNLETARPGSSPRADLWTLAPPCQPHTRRGRRRDVDDPRSAALTRLTERLPEARPRFLLLENVPGFQDSRAHAALLQALAGYRVTEHLLCPSDLGWPNRRRRFYLVASRAADLRPLPSAPPEPPRLADMVEPTCDLDPALRVAPDLAERYAGALSIVERHDPAARTACFTSAYGRSPVRSGSYLQLPDGGLRRFHPREVLALLGFPEDFRLPDDLPLRRAWSLVGNSLSLPAVRQILKTLPLAHS